MALEHAHVPHPVEEHGLQICRVFCWCVGFRNPSAWALRTGRQRPAERKTDCERDLYPTDSLKVHRRLLSCPVVGGHSPSLQCGMEYGRSILWVEDASQASGLIINSAWTRILRMLGNPAIVSIWRTLDFGTE